MSKANTEENLSQQIASELGEMDSIEIDLNELYYDDAEKGHSIRQEKEKALKTSSEAGLGFIQKVANHYVQKEPEKIEEYLGKNNAGFIKYDEEKKKITVDAENIRAIVDKIEEYSKKHEIPTDHFVRKFKEIAGQKKDGLENTVDADAIQNSRLVGWLVEQLHILHLYDQKKDLYDKEKTEADYKRSVNRREVHVRDLNSSPNTLAVLAADREVAKLRIDLKSMKSAYASLALNEKYDESKLEPTKKLKDKDFWQSFSLFKQDVIDPFSHWAINNTFGAGLLTSTNAKDTQLWKETTTQEKEMVHKLFKKLGVDIERGKVDIKSIEADLGRQRQFGLLTAEEFNYLMAFYKDLAKGDEKKEKFIDDLQRDINKFNDDIEAKIKKAEVSDDDLHKLRMIQAALILSPLFGISLVPLAVNAFLPFFEGQEMASWIASFLSADGPLAWTGIPYITDWMRLDELTSTILHADAFSGIMSLPQTILTGENNPIAIAFRNVIGEGLANSFFGNWVLAAVVNNYTQYFDRETKLTKDRDAIRKNVKHGLEKMYDEMVASAQKLGLDKPDKIIDYRTNAAIAAKMSEWLLSKHSDPKHSKACEQFVEKVFDKNKELKDKVLELLEKIAAPKNMQAQAAPDNESEDDKKKRNDKYAAEKEAKTKTADEASLELLRLFNSELQKDKPSEEFKKFFELCFAKDQESVARFFDASEQFPDADKRMKILNDKFNEATKEKKDVSKKDVGYDKKLEILKARETLELAGEYGVDTGYPPCYGLELLYLDLLRDLDINSDSPLVRDLEIPTFNHSTGEADRYDKNLLDDLILLKYLMINHGEKYQDIIESGLGDSKNLKEYLIGNEIIKESEIHGVISSYSNVEVKKRVIAIQNCLESREVKGNTETDDQLYARCLKDINDSINSQNSDSSIDHKYKEVEEKYDDRVVKAAKDIKKDKKILDLKLTPTTSVQRVDNNKPLSVTQLIRDTKKRGFGK